MASAAEAHRALLKALNANTALGVMKLWPLLDIRDLDASFPNWQFAMRQLVERNRAAAAISAEEWLATERLAAGIAGTFPAITPPLNEEQFDTSLRVTGPVRAKKALSVGRTPDDAMKNALVAVIGAATRLVLDASRQTVMATSLADPAAHGWQRIGSGHACDFCQMLIGRGAVYSDKTADFAAHDHCSCMAAPAYKGATARSARDYTQSDRRAAMSDTQRAADNARVRDWIAATGDN